MGCCCCTETTRKCIHRRCLRDALNYKNCCPMCREPNIKARVEKIIKALKLDSGQAEANVDVDSFDSKLRKQLKIIKDLGLDKPDPENNGDALSQAVARLRAAIAGNDPYTEYPPERQIGDQM